jgi:hypothetical protein
MTSSMHETELAVFSYEEALANAESETVRELDEVADVIRYVAFIPELGDFCLCELEYRGERWFKRVRVLRQDERLPGEEISDEAIRAYAAKGRRVAQAGRGRAAVSREVRGRARGGGRRREAAAPRRDPPRKGWAPGSARGCVAATRCCTPSAPGGFEAAMQVVQSPPQPPPSPPLSPQPAPQPDEQPTWLAQ